MSDDHFTPAYFKALLQQMESAKRQFAERQMKKGGHQRVMRQPGCQVCGKQLGSQTQKFNGEVRAKPCCPACTKALKDGNAAFVTLEVPARYWIGEGAHPQLNGKVTTITVEQMDALLRRTQANQ